MKRLSMDTGACTIMLTVDAVCLPKRLDFILMGAFKKSTSIRRIDEVGFCDVLRGN